jgi:hypothetical protein
MMLFALILAFFWISQILKALSASAGMSDYVRAPTIFWWVRIFDLGVFIPLIIISSYVFLTRPHTGGYAIMLMMMGALMLAFPVIAGSVLFTILFSQQTADIQGFIFFFIMTLPIFPSYFYLIKEKVFLKKIK